MFQKFLIVCKFKSIKALVVALAKPLARAFFPIGSVRRVLRGPLTGVRFRVAAGMGLSYAIGKDGFHLDWFCRHVAPNALVFDIGANRGQMSLLFSRLVDLDAGGSVLSFEPVPELFSQLRENMLMNGYDIGGLRNAAIGNKAGKLKFLFSEEHSTQGKLADVENTYEVCGAKSVYVDCLLLDEIEIPSNHCGDILLKIDVEGAAAAVIKGGIKFIRQYRPMMYLELHGPEEQGALKFLADDGYRFKDPFSGHEVDPIESWVSPVVALPAPRV